MLPAVSLAVILWLLGSTNGCTRVTDKVLDVGEVQKLQFPDISNPQTHIEEVEEEIGFLMHQLVNDAEKSVEDVKQLKASKAACKEQMHIFVHTIHSEGTKVEL